MAPAAVYDRLSGLDESFLHLERPETPMHVGAVAVLEREPFYDARGRFRLDEVRALVASRLQLIPRFRKRVMAVPLGQGRPVWVDHEGFDIADHVRVTALPAPGTRRQLRELAERLTVQVLDRRRPLWELWFVEGVDHGEHVGLVHKSHHTLTDGISGVDIATVLLDFTAEPTLLPPDEWVAAPAPDPTRLMLDSARERLSRPTELVGTARQLADAPREALARAADLGRSIGSLVDAQVVAPRLSLNAPVGRGRRFETVRVSVDDVKRVRAAFGGTINDVILAGVGTAVARLLDARGELRPELVLKVFCPVSVRDDDQRMQLGNRISAMLVPLAVGEPDPLVRLAAVRRTTADLKERRQAVGAAALLGLSDYAAPTMLGLAARAAHAQRFANLMITNIPGPQVPLYCLGARMLEVYPVVPLSRNLTLNVAILSYCGQLHFGLIGDGDAGRDLEVVAGGIEDAFAELGALAAREV
ncbi:MAG TPA: wax ester/triacylglycerol synthase family O-acyltransferase [Acidimicrobiia bacterium]|jgi:WS/DGAT/MGAT family acyltransferase|nr:wax ester/triacylglycerol synthase family O-acyltransferase [Acidimicrobiia bacterium]